MTYRAQDRYYYSIRLDDLKASSKTSTNGSTRYCKTKATDRRTLRQRRVGPRLGLAPGRAAIVAPGSLAARFLKARIHRLRGELADMVTTLETIRQNKPEKFASADDAKAWYFAHRILGDMYVDEKPAEAVQCFLEFRKSDEAGAATSYKLGKAYESLGDFKNAAAAYEEVTAYERHPLFYEARDALDRVKRAPARTQGDFV